MSNRKRNVSYIKPEDPAFLKDLKKRAGYDNRNHKFDKLESAEEDFLEDTESEQPQVVVLTKDDLTAEEAEIEKKKIELQELQTKADLSQRVIFKSKQKSDLLLNNNKRKSTSKKDNPKKSKHLLSFGSDDEDQCD